MKSSPGCSPVGGVSRTFTSDLPAPLPMLGVRAGWVEAPNRYVDTQVQFFKVKIDETNVRWTDAHIGATWMFHRSFGVGLAYNWFGTRLDVEKERLQRPPRAELFRRPVQPHGNALSLHCKRQA